MGTARLLVIHSANNNSFSHEIVLDNANEAHGDDWSAFIYAQRLHSKIKVDGGLLQTLKVSLFCGQYIST